MSSTSTSKRKQDEKNVKMLRELAAQPVNKQCFDCHQRGPTYVNMTIGSFVCTKCSGILIFKHRRMSHVTDFVGFFSRGLNPPHRVKSISMAAFTPDEIDFVRNRGNEYGKKVWLGLYDGDTRSFDNYNSDEQQMKDFLILKYERKRWYVNPADIAKQQSLLSSAQKQPQSSTNGTNTGVKQERTSTSLIDTGSPLASPTQNSFPQSRKPASTVGSKSLDLFDSDPFSSPVLPNKQQPVPAPRAINLQKQASSGGGGNFANFANFGDAFAASPPPQPTSQSGFHHAPGGARLPPPPGQDPNLMIQKSATVPASLTVSSAGQSHHPAPAPVTAPVASSGGDKYSALAELDGLFSSNGTAPTGAGSTLNSSWTAGTGSSFGGGKSSSAFGGSPLAADAFSSSFTTGSNIPKSGSAMATTGNTFETAANPFMSMPPPTSQQQSGFAGGWPPQSQAGMMPRQPQPAGNPFFAGGMPPQQAGMPFMAPQQQGMNLGTSNPFGGLTPVPNAQQQQAPMAQGGFPTQGAQPPGMWAQPQSAWQQNPFMGGQQMGMPQQQQQVTNWNPFL